MPSLPAAPRRLVGRHKRGEHFHRIAQFFQRDRSRCRFPKIASQTRRCAAVPVSGGGSEAGERPWRGGVIARRGLIGGAALLRPAHQAQHEGGITRRDNRLDRVGIGGGAPLGKGCAQRVMPGTSPSNLIAGATSPSAKTSRLRAMPRTVAKPAQLVRKPAEFVVLQQRREGRQDGPQSAHADPHLVDAFRHPGEHRRLVPDDLFGAGARDPPQRRAGGHLRIEMTSLACTASTCSGSAGECRQTEPPRRFAAAFEPHRRDGEHVERDIVQRRNLAGLQFEFDFADRFAAIAVAPPRPGPGPPPPRCAFRDSGAASRFGGQSRCGPAPGVLRLSRRDEAASLRRLRIGRRARNRVFPFAARQRRAADPVAESCPRQI